MIQSTASAAAAKGGCASSRLDHGLKCYVIPEGCTSSRLIHGFSDCDQGDRVAVEDLATCAAKHPFQTNSIAALVFMQSGKAALADSLRTRRLHFLLQS